jgi:hypothetical protein
MKISPEEEEKKTAIFLSSNEIKAGDKSKCHWIGALLKSHKKKMSQHIAVVPLVRMKSSYPIINKFDYIMYIKYKK